MNEILKQIPIDSSYTVKTINWSKAFKGRFRPDLSDLEFIVFEQSNKELIRFRIDSVLSIEGGTVNLLKLEKELLKE